MVACLLARLHVFSRRSSAYTFHYMRNIGHYNVFPISVFLPFGEFSKHQLLYNIDTSVWMVWPSHGAFLHSNVLVGIRAMIGLETVSPAQQ